MCEWLQEISTDLHHLFQAESKVANDQHVWIVPTSWSGNRGKVVCVCPIEVHNSQYRLEMVPDLFLSDDFCTFFLPIFSIEKEKLGQPVRSF